MGFNKVIIEGRLTADPDFKTTQSGVEYCNFTVAVDRNYKNGEERLSDFISCKAWRGSAKFISQYFKKGDPILIDGRIKTSKYTADDGTNRYRTDVVVENATFTLGKRSDAEKKSSVPLPVGEFAEINDIDTTLPF